MIVAYDEFSLHVGVIAAVVPLSHVPVAVYVPVPPSFTDDAADRAGSVAVTFTTVTDCDAVRVTPPLV